MAENKETIKEKGKTWINNIPIWATDELKNAFGKVTKLVGGLVGYRGHSIQLHRRSYEKNPEPYSFQKWISKYIEINDNQIKYLKEIEQKWLNIDYTVGYTDEPKRYGGKSYNTITYFYSLIGPFKDPILAGFEMGWFEKGIGYGISHGDRVDQTTGETYSFEKITDFTNNEKRIINADGMEEAIIPIGWEKIPGIIEMIEKVQKQLDTKILKSPELFRDNDTEQLMAFIEQLIKLLKKVQEVEKKHFDQLSEIIGTHKQIQGAWEVLWRDRPEHVRFKHTYRIIAPYIYETRKNGRRIYLRDFKQLPGEMDVTSIREHEEMLNNFRVIYFKDTIEPPIREHGFTHEFFIKYPWEVDWGLDHNGMPLEVEEDGTVLIDKWWIETLRNEWQKNLILSKIGNEEHHTFKGEFGNIIRQIVNHFSQLGVRPRKIDTKFMTLIDIAKAGIYMSAEYDAYRDDNRDARYHPYSKTIYDYTKAMWKFDYNIWLNRPEHRGIIPYTRVTLKYNEQTDYNDYDPTMLPEEGDDRDIKGTYNGFHYWNFKEHGFEFDTYDYDLDRGKNIGSRVDPVNGLVRTPTHMNPAFDRRALNSNWIHWGRMYYYEWPIDIGKYSENPFPSISTRGIANFIVDMVLKHELKLKDQKRVLRKSTQGYDWGVRQQGVKEFKKDIFDPDGCLNYGHKEDDPNTMIQPFAD